MNVDTLIALATAYLNEAVSSPRQITAHLAALLGVGLVMAGALMRTMTPLRWAAVGSNIGLFCYGLLRPSPITMSVAAVLLPINIYRAVEVTRLTRRVRRATSAAEHAGLWLKPYMKTRKLRAGKTLFSKGDRAEHLYLLVSGQLELLGTGRLLEPGRIFGEIALFSPGRQRTQTVRARTPCVLLQIHDSTVKQLFYQEPAFGFHMIELLAERLSNDVQRAERQAGGETTQ